MTWVVMGSSGFIGSALTAFLRADGEEVRIFLTPRLSSMNMEVSALAAEARGHRSVTHLAAQLRGVDVVVLAAGMATPDTGEHPDLIGANALLPGVVATACHIAGVQRLVHLSSAAVQGRAASLDETVTTNAFSAYSRSKALGEQVLGELRGECATEIVILRATSVQGAGRKTTSSLRRVARSRFASVAGSGAGPSPVSSVMGLTYFIRQVGLWPESVPGVVLQPWGGLSAAEVLRLAGGREPLHLPVFLCRAVVGVGYGLSRLARGRFDGSVRRVEALWFGQVVNDCWACDRGLRATANLPTILANPQ